MGPMRRLAVYSDSESGKLLYAVKLPPIRTSKTGYDKALSVLISRPLLGHVKSHWGYALESEPCVVIRAHPPTGRSQRGEG